MDSLRGVSRAGTQGVSDIPDTGKLGHFTVTLADKPAGEASAAASSHEVAHDVQTIESRGFRRTLGVRTGSLDRQQNKALLGFIKSGEGYAADGKTKVKGSMEDRVSAFEKIMSGETHATPEEKKAAFDIMIKALEDDSGFTEDILEIIGLHGRNLGEPGQCNDSVKNGKAARYEKLLSRVIPQLKAYAETNIDASDPFNMSVFTKIDGQEQIMKQLAEYQKHYRDNQ